MYDILSSDYHGLIHESNSNLKKMILCQMQVWSWSFLIIGRDTKYRINQLNLRKSIFHLYYPNHECCGFNNFIRDKQPNIGRKYSSLLQMIEMSTNNSIFQYQISVVIQRANVVGMV